MDKNVLSIPFRSQLATPNLSPRTDEVNHVLDEINNSQDKCYEEVTAQLVTKVSTLQTTIESLQTRVIQIERDAIDNRSKEKNYTLMSSQMEHQKIHALHDTNSVTNAPRLPIAQPPKIHERIKYFELLQTHGVHNSQHSSNRDNLKNKSFVKVGIPHKLESKDKWTNAQQNFTFDTDESRLNEREVVVKTELCKSNSTKNDSHVELESDSVRIKVKRSQLEELSIYEPRIKPFRQRKGSRRQRNVGCKSRIRDKPKRTKKMRVVSTGTTQSSNGDQPFNYMLFVSLVIAVVFMALALQYPICHLYRCHCVCK
ncbi:hypothetical protein FOB58_003393 [Candida parapsilosis]|uniref:Uncharacterized protein n=2 Tax=Candida parapsilosis TaxID=5480 RepID=G8BHW1_CANPC|nr:uncharacterized protein CPAR2_400260 [Candida parapsilosis]KAF6046920.1 hypothetical protein FOB60_004456 [Candida parapsilosis]KAF6047315.1 hypothetical protein FOB58_003393 [Candida parapsilosis]KAF6050714.1 hypothetical protein FOB59_002960 [Candida parapsilosis]KAF6061833.1 hypothetical protein FOB61_004590 [Candida parapsilosis]CAD1811300.1 unnamed protein product [Candida parapsilosis]